jgi:hypothetical protein
VGAGHLFKLLVKVSQIVPINETWGNDFEQNGSEVDHDYFYRIGICG